MKLDEIMKTGLSRLDVVKVPTAVNPLLWLVGLTTTLSLVAAILIDDRVVRLALLGFASFPVLVTVVAYSCFSSVTRIGYNPRSTASVRGVCRSFTSGAALRKL